MDSPAAPGEVKSLIGLIDRLLDVKHKKGLEDISKLGQADDPVRNARAKILFLLTYGLDGS